jgi:hypothetical protein
MPPTLEREVIMAEAPGSASPSIVLVHGGFVDGSVVEAEGSHAIYVSRPDVVAWLIEKAAQEALVSA